MKKRLLALLLALSMLAALTACGGKKDDAGTPEQEVAAEDVDGTVDQPQETPEAGEEVSETQDADGSTETDAAAPVENLPAEPAEKPESGNLPADTTQKPESKPIEKPVQKPVEKPAESKSVDLAAFFETFASGENRPAMMQADGEVLDAFYPGLSAIKTKQCGVYTAMISAAVGELALVEVENAADVQAVKDMFQARINYQVGDDENPGGAWYPQTIEGWKNGSRIVSNGNYVMLIALSEGADDVVNSFNALFA